MRDLTSARAIIAKGLLFLVLGISAATLLLFLAPSWQIAALLVVAIWAFCRAYYFAFYVIEKYVDPSFKFSGLGSALKYLLSRSSKQGSNTKFPN